MTKDLQHIEKDEKTIFKKSDYTSFMLWVFILGGLFAVPLVWSFLLGLRYIDMFLKPYIVFSLMLCVGVLIAFRRNGNTSLFRTIAAIVIGVIVASGVAAGSGKVAFVSGTLLGFAILILCGRLGIIFTRFIHRHNDK